MADLEAISTVEPAPNGRARPTPRRLSRPPPGVSNEFKGFVLAMFAGVLLLSVATPIWKIGPMPVRAALAIVLLLFLWATNGEAARNALRTHRSTLWVTLGFAVLGGVVSAANKMPPPELIGQLIEIHLQTAANLMLGAIVVEICGEVSAMNAFLFAIGVTALVAVAQFFGIDAAWQIRGAIGRLQHEVFLKYGFFDDRRPMGLSLSPILLATQLCLAFAAYIVVRQRKHETAGRPKYFDIYMFVATGAFLFVCFASGNRSPILGGLVFVMLYVMLRRPKLFWMSLPFVIVLSYLVLPDAFQMLEGSGSRVTEVGDKSSQGRGTLVYYGTRLFLDRPFGYGLGFDPTQHWAPYWSEISKFPQPQVVQIFPLHNYILNMLNFYGCVMLALLPFVFNNIRKNATILLAFVPYIMHILFHNTGPFWNDFLIWFVIAIGSAREFKRAPTGARSGRPQRAKPAPRRRVVAQAPDAVDAAPSAQH